MCRGDASVSVLVTNADASINRLVNQQSCEKRGCCWSPLDERNVPWCFFPTNHGYTVESSEELSQYGQYSLSTGTTCLLQPVLSICCWDLCLCDNDLEVSRQPPRLSRLSRLLMFSLGCSRRTLSSIQQLLSDP